MLKFALSDTAGPALSANGTVFVYDWVAGGFHVDQEYQSAVEKSSFLVRTYDAETGEDRAYFPLVAMGANGVLPRLSLLEGAVGAAVRPVPPTFVGCPP